MIYQSKGPLRYSYEGDVGHKLIVEVDPEIASFYRSLIPKYHKLNPQRYRPHISVVRKEVPINMECWGKYEGDLVEFEYSNEVHHGTVYWWLNAFSYKLEEIRLELGLPVSTEYTRPPGDYIKCFHITIGNNKGEQCRT